MHRQSLGSPGSKLLSHGLIGAKEDNNILADDQKLPNLLAAVEEKDKLEKPHKSLQRGERIVHIIPILILLCFLILYLSSHSPSPIDLAQFSGFKPFSKLQDSSEIDDFGGLMEIERDDVLAIRSLRNLQEIGSPRPACFSLSSVYFLFLFFSDYFTGDSVDERRISSHSYIRNSGDCTCDLCIKFLLFEKLKRSFLAFGSVQNLHSSI